MWRAACIACAIAWRCTDAYAILIVTPSLEWLADQCDDAGIYTVSSIAESEKEWRVNLSLTLKEDLKGHPVAEIRQEYIRAMASDALGPDVAKGYEFLICFEQGEAGAQRRPWLINLDTIHAGGGANVAASSDLRLIKNKKEILKLFEARLQLYANDTPPAPGGFDDNIVAIPGDSELGAAVWSGSIGLLRVPADLLAKAKSLSPSREFAGPSSGMAAFLRRFEQPWLNYVVCVVCTCVLACIGVVVWTRWTRKG